MDAAQFKDISTFLSKEAERFEAVGLIVELETIDIPTRTIQLRIESATHIGEVVVWAERCRVSMAVGRPNGDPLFDRNYEVCEDTPFHWQLFHQYFEG